jgi:hypothetical protein
VRLIGYPTIMEKLVSAGMRSKAVMTFALTLLGNLEDSRVRSVEQRGFWLLKKIAELKP